MPWQETSVMQVRQEFVTVAQHAGLSIAELCRRYGISRGQPAADAIAPTQLGDAEPGVLGHGDKLLAHLHDTRLLPRHPRLLLARNEDAASGVTHVAERLLPMSPVHTRRQEKGLG